MSCLFKPLLAFALAIVTVPAFTQTPLKVEDKTISLFGRKVILADSGFPDKIQTYFNPELTGMADTATNVLGENIHFHIVNAATHKDITFKNTGLNFTDKLPDIVRWTSAKTSDFLQMDITGYILVNGLMEYTVKLTALADVNLDDTKFHIPFNKLSSKYFSGLGQKEGLRPDTVKWKWDTKNYDGTWVGQPNAGLQYSLHDEHYTKPSKGFFYPQKTLQTPASWDNGGKGAGIITIKGTTMLSETTTGARSMKKGDVLYYNFTLLVTPDKLKSAGK